MNQLEQFGECQNLQFSCSRSTADSTNNCLYPYYYRCNNKMSSYEPSLAFGNTIQSVGSNEFEEENYPESNDGLNNYTNNNQNNNEQDEEEEDAGPDVPFSLVQRGPPLLMGDGKRQNNEKSQNSPRYVEDNETVERLPSSAEVVEVLHTLLPPITLNDSQGRVWKQYCSTPMSNRDDVYRLQDALDSELIERQARPYGICPVRELLYSQSFDELLRQVALESPERGLMLLRVRDQLRMSIACYQTLFHNSTTFGTRRAVMAEKNLLPYQKQVEELQRKKEELQSQVYDLKDKLKVVEEYETKESDNQRKQEQIERTFLEDQISQLSSFLRNTGAIVDDDEEDKNKRSKGKNKGKKT